ncbi:MAG TPA: FoF1 ATP synthase subunit a [Candidatus Obscuribacterales bacterium]
MSLGNNLPLASVPGFGQTAEHNFLPFDLPLLGHMGTWGDVHIDTIVLAWACMLGILAAAAVVRPMLTANGPGNKVQAVTEMLYDFCKGIAKEQIHDQWRPFFPLIAAIFIFVLIGNLIGILPWPAMWNSIYHSMPGFAEKYKEFEVAAPTTDFNVTFGLAVVALITYLGSGFWAHKVKYLKLYLNPIEWMDLIIRPATLSIRLMMVITADEILRGAALMLAPVIVPTGVMGFEMGIALIQAFVFALLTSIYIGLTVAHH